MKASLSEYLSAREDWVQDILGCYTKSLPYRSFRQLTETENNFVTSWRTTVFLGWVLHNGENRWEISRGRNGGDCVRDRHRSLGCKINTARGARSCRTQEECMLHCDSNYLWRRWASADDERSEGVLSGEVVFARGKDGARRNYRGGSCERNPWGNRPPNWTDSSALRRGVRHDLVSFHVHRYGRWCSFCFLCVNTLLCLLHSNHHCFGIMCTLAAVIHGWAFEGGGGGGWEGEGERRGCDACWQSLFQHARGTSVVEIILPNVWKT